MLDRISGWITIARKGDTMIINRRMFLLQSLTGVGLLAGANRTVGQAFDPSIIGTNTFEGYGLYQAIELIRELGFQTIEVHPWVDHRLMTEFDRISADERRKIKSALVSFRHVTTHLPFTDLHYFSPFAPIAEFSVKQIDIALEASAYIGAEIAVIHPRRASGLTLQQYWTLMLRRFRRWGDIAEKAGIRLALETGSGLERRTGNTVDDYVRLIKEIGHDHVGATIDVGHQAKYVELQRKVKPEERGTPEGIKAYNDLTHEIIDQLGPKVFHLHVHDIEPATWREHQPLHYGFVDYPRLIKKLRKIDYRGLLVFEIVGPTSEMGKYLADGKRKLEKYLSES